MQKKELDTIDRLREQDAEIRPLNAELKQLREAAVLQAAELAARVAELEQGLERVGGTSKGYLLEQIREMKDKLEVLSERRKANQLKISDVNLARRAAEASTKSARKQV